MIRDFFVNWYEILTFGVKINIINLKGVIFINIYNTIKESFSCDEPIFSSDIERLFPERSRPWIDKVIKTMLDKNQLKRFSTGVYYIPRKTLMGESLLNPQKVITKKYIRNGADTFGYVSGTALLNKLGLTAQVPNLITVVTNNESSRGRKVMIGSQPVYIMRPYTEITNENYTALQLLEAVKLVDINDLDKTEKGNLEKYINDNSITLPMVSKYCTFFPDYVSKRVLGGSLIGILTQQ